jgi:hypothetical protein
VLLSTVFALEHIQRYDCLLSNEEIGKIIDSAWVGGMLEELRCKQDKDSSKSLYKIEEFISPHLALKTMLAELEPTWVHGEGSVTDPSNNDSVFVGVDNGTSEDELGAALELFFNNTTKNHGQKRRMAVLLLSSSLFAARTGQSNHQ